MTNTEQLKEIAFNDFYSCVKYAEYDDLSMDNLSDKEKEKYCKYFDKYKDKILSKLDNMKI